MDADALALGKLLVHHSDASEQVCCRERLRVDDPGAYKLLHSSFGSCTQRRCLAGLGHCCLHLYIYQVIIPGHRLCLWLHLHLQLHLLSRCLLRLCLLGLGLLCRRLLGRGLQLNLGGGPLALLRVLDNHLLGRLWSSVFPGFGADLGLGPGVGLRQVRFRVVVTEPVEREGVFLCHVQTWGSESALAAGSNLAGTARGLLSIRRWCRAVSQVA
mmetsp:Transcript_63965/g.144360  ORF Transcript_63965/g.144360 Transcript_63965/m.144360 type:complete len:214 (+) Transcript_63965:947-1588(+)